MMIIIIIMMIIIIIMMIITEVTKNLQFRLMAIYNQIIILMRSRFEYKQHLHRHRFKMHLFPAA